MAYQAAMKGENLRKGPWLEEEDERLTSFVSLMGERRWDSLARASGMIHHMNARIRSDHSLFVS
jgi:myb proto-oncogene protein